MAEQQNPIIGGARAAVGQGLGMGWGDEAEAWLRSKLGQGTYEENVAKIRREYGDYSQQYPVTSSVAEFGGAVLPGVVAMFVPGAQPAGAAHIGASGTRAVMKLGALGATSGAVSGAGSATEGQRAEGAATGGALGGATGLAALPFMRGLSAGGKWLAERLAPTEARVTERAAGKLNEALQRSNMTPQEIERVVAQDKSMGVPSTVANVSPATAKLAETVAQRTGAGAEKVEEQLIRQRAGARERTHQQVVKGLKPGNFYEDEQRLVAELRAKAPNLYDEAYAFGPVEDPRILEVLKNPQFKAFYDKARQIANTEAQAAKLSGGDPSRFELKEIYKLAKDAEGNTIIVGVDAPDVRTLDYIKRGIDASIEEGFKGKGMSTAEASALRDLRKVFVNAIDENVPAYKTARSQYAGDLEVIDALRSGMSDFHKLDHEQIVERVATMSKAEKEAFRTGVARDLYSKIMGSSGNFNAAQRIIGSPEMQAKLQPLFDGPGQFRLFQAALERESQLFQQSNRILGGSQTGQRTQARQDFEGGPGAGQVIGDAITGGFWGSLSGLTARVISKTQMNEKTAEKLADMLMSKDPKEVAAVVKLLEQQAESAAPKAFRAGAAERGVTTGVSGSVWPAPAGTPSTQSIEDSVQEPKIEGPDIEEFLKQMDAPRK
jgi:hypothetical protein